MKKEVVIPASSGSCFKIRQGEYLKVIDLQGSQVSDLFCVDQNDLRNYFSAARTMDYNDGLFLKEQGKLYSNKSEVMMTLIKDSCGVHDLLMPPCSLEMFQLVSGNKEPHPSCHENLAKNFIAFDVPDYFIVSTFNIFMNVSVGEHGRFKINSPTSKAGDFVVLRAEKDLIVGLTACAHEETNGHQCKPVAYQILSDLNDL